MHFKFIENHFIPRSQYGNSIMKNAWIFFPFLNRSKELRFIVIRVDPFQSLKRVNEHWSTESVSDSNFEEDDARGIETRGEGERGRGKKRSLGGEREDRWRKIYTCLHDVRHDRIAMFEIQLKEVGGREKRREKRVESDRAGSALRPPRPFQPRGLSNKKNEST